MRPVLIALGLAALATPSFALTITTAPNRDELQHLRPTQAAQGVDIRDSWLGSGRATTGLSYGAHAADYTDAPRFRFDDDMRSDRARPRTRPLSPTGADLNRLAPRR